MTDPTAIPPDPAPNLSSFTDDLSSEIFRFDTTVWSDAPPFVPRDPDGNETLSRRNANHAIYRQIGNATAWQRYITLGYYAIDDCLAFDREWRIFGTNPLMMYQIIWYNYMYHVDRAIDIPPKLYAWATAIAQPYLQQNNPNLLEMDTLIKDWTELKASSTSPARAPHGEWIPVTPRGSRARNRQVHTPPSNQTTDQARHSSVPDFNLPPPDNNMHMNDTTMASEADDDELVANPPDTRRPTNPDRDMPMTNAPWFNQTDDNSTEIFDTPRPPPLTHVPTNDGTHRLTIRWSLTNQDPTDLKTLEQSKELLDTAIYKLMQHIFKDTDGYFYRWESTDLLHAQTISQMTAAQIRDYVTPVITFVHSRNLLIFGARFSFNTSPAKWRSDKKVEILKEENLNVSVSNSISTSGKLVIAGYILLKAPNSTHRHRYVQHLMRHLPEATPYFDVVRLSKSPLDQVIPHLAIQCGEQHVTPLCQALSNYLTGENRALFIPRYALRTMTKEKITQRFDFHKHWCRSSVPISLSPTIAHIDQPRREYYPDGTTVVRSAREWAETLFLEDGSSAYCDIVNGTSDRKTILHVPRHYQTTAKIQWLAYKQRLYPPSHREARFLDSLEGLPSEIQISTEVNSNLDRFDSVSSAAIWRQAPDSIRERQPDQPTQIANPRERRQKRASGRSRHKESLFLLNSSVGSITSVPETDTEGDGDTDTELNSVNSGHLKRPNTAPQGASLLDIHMDHQSSASTHSLTRGSMTTAQARFREVEAVLDRQRQALATQTRKSDEHLSAIERQLSRLDQLENKLEDVSASVRQATFAQKLQAQDLRDDIQKNATDMANQQREHRDYCDDAIGTLGKNVVAVMEGLLKMQSDVAELSRFLMQGLATIPSPGPKRRKQRMIDDDDASMTQRERPLLDSNEQMILDDDDLDDEALSPLNTPVNLEQAFDRARQDLQMATSSPIPTSPPHSLQSDSTPTNPMSDVTDKPPNTQPPSAPLDPRNNSNTGPAGAMTP